MNTTLSGLLSVEAGENMHLPLNLIVSANDHDTAPC